MNKAQQVREAMGLTVTDAGTLLCGCEGKAAYDHWYQLERAKNFSGMANAYLDLLLFLAITRKLKTPGAAKTLDKYLTILKNGE